MFSGKTSLRVKQFISKFAPACVNVVLIYHRTNIYMSCIFKILWGGRWQKEAGATTGEEVEQINSHFSRLGNSTKHMLPEGVSLLIDDFIYIIFITKKITSVAEQCCCEL
jgi:hypothetical protein